MYRIGLTNDWKVDVNDLVKISLPKDMGNALESMLQTHGKRNLQEPITMVVEISSLEEKMFSGKFVSTDFSSFYTPFIVAYPLSVFEDIISRDIPEASKIPHFMPPDERRMIREVFRKRGYALLEKDSKGKAELYVPINIFQQAYLTEEKEKIFLLLTPKSLLLFREEYADVILRDCSMRKSANSSTLSLPHQQV